MIASPVLQNSDSWCAAALSVSHNAEYVFICFIFSGALSLVTLWGAEEEGSYDPIIFLKSRVGLTSVHLTLRQCHNSVSQIKAREQGE